jgi:hypothetical protein
MLTRSDVVSLASNAWLIALSALSAQHLLAQQVALKRLQELNRKRQQSVPDEKRVRVNHARAL